MVKLPKIGIGTPPRQHTPRCPLDPPPGKNILDPCKLPPPPQKKNHVQLRILPSDENIVCFLFSGIRLKDHVSVPNIYNLTRDVYTNYTIYICL